MVLLFNLDRCAKLGPLVSTVHTGKARLKYPTSDVASAPGFCTHYRWAISKDQLMFLC